MSQPGQNHFLLSTLPTLEHLDQSPPITAEELLQLVNPFAGPRKMIEAILLSDDLLQRQAVLAEEIEAAAPAVLSEAQLRDEEPLPDFLAASGRQERQEALGEDLLWQAYFRYLASIADEQHSRFLRLWTRFEVSLRNAVAQSRADALGLEPGRYLVAVELSDETIDFSAIVEQWSSAKTPLAGLRVLDEARWQWVNDHDGWFSFHQDELAAYAVRLMLLSRWHRINEAENQNVPTPTAWGRTTLREG